MRVERALEIARGPLFLVGPTATGKTSLAVRAAEVLGMGIELFACDPGMDAQEPFGGYARRTISPRPADATPPVAAEGDLETATDGTLAPARLPGVLVPALRLRSLDDPGVWFPERWGFVATGQAGSTVQSDGSFALDGVPAGSWAVHLVYLLEESGYDTGIDLDALIGVARRVEAIIGRPLPGQVMRAGPRLRTYDAAATRAAVG